MTAFLAVLAAHVLDPVRVVLMLAGFWASLQTRGLAKLAIVVCAIVGVAFIVAALLNARYFVDSVVFGLISNTIIMAALFGIRWEINRIRSS